MKRLSAFCIILIFISVLNIVFNHCETGDVYIVGELMGIEITTETTDDNNEIIPTSHNELGTIAFVKEDNEFLALGHNSSNKDENAELDIDCFGVKLMCINKSSDNKIGSVIGSVNKDEKLGHAYKDTKCGIVGKLDKIDEQKYLKVKTASRYNIKKGKANILTRIEENELKSFDVEITDIDYFNENMNIKIKITDEELIKKTGGIIQGMSGTPLMQENKLVGVLNYVKTDDSTCAYAVFVDKLI